MLKEFKEFALKGNMLDLAVGIILGAAFGAIVNSLVKDIIMPPIGLALAGVNFADLFINLSGQPVASVEEAQAAGLATINYGLFINALINFVIVAFVLFLVIRQINRMRAKPIEPEVNVKNCPYCTEKINLQATRCPHCTSEL